MKRTLTAVVLWITFIGIALHIHRAPEQSWVLAMAHQESPPTYSLAPLPKSFKVVSHAKVQHVQPAAPAGSIKARVIAAWPGDDNWAVRTVECESGFDPMQIGGGGNNYFGLFQFGPWARANYGNPLTMSVEQQTLAAWRLIKATSSSQWSCSPYSYNP